MRSISLVLSLLILFPTGCASRNIPDANIFLDVGHLNPIEIGVLTPDKRFVFLYSDEFHCSGITVSNGRVLIEPSKATGYFWNSDGKRSEVAIFQKKGLYIVYASENLETEIENSSAITMEYLNQHPIDMKPVAHACQAQK